MPRAQNDTSNRIFGAPDSVSTGPATSVVRVTATPSEAEHSYTIVTYTGDSKFAGTDANVFVTLYGSERQSEELHLQKSLDHDDSFERGNRDTFNLKSKDLGCLYKLSIRHDNTGRWPGWLLNKVVVVDEETGKKSEFTCYDWLFKGSDSSLDHELEVNGIPIMGIDSMTDVNGPAHHTDKYKTKSAIVLRRGQSFKIKVQLARDYEQDDSFYFTLKTGPRPRDIDKTMITVAEYLPKEFHRCKTEEKWGYTIRDISDPKNIEVEIFIPATALPAKYEVLIESDEGTLYKPQYPVYVLFNPWCKEDEVYMDDENKLREYILKQNGQIYIGKHTRPRPRNWYFGQFEEISLDTVFKLLESVKANKRDSPVEVSRIISSKVNSCDNEGVLEGNWSGKYEGGKTPTYWNSTPAILETYMVDSLPVKFGQCWVFSGIVTALMRTIGIPCRSVTNFSSAHDSDGNCTNDIYIDEDGEKIEEMSADSVWNFHVWNDAWMARKDLPPGYGGWQAIDATPQERSQGLFQMGPAPHRAIKEGSINIPYDTGFVLAEVNADTIYWQKNGEGKFDIVYRNRTSVGKKVSTKAVGSEERHDVTNDYKFAEGSVLEKGAVRSALLLAKNEAVKVTRKDVEMEMIVGDSVVVGQDIKVMFKMKNTANEDLRATLAFTGQIVRYDGVAKAKLQKYKERVDLKANSEKSIPIAVRAGTYIKNVGDDTMLRFIGTLAVNSTGQIVLCDDIVALENPTLDLNTPDTVSVGKEMLFTVSFENPLDEALTECEMYVDGSIIEKRMYIKDIKNVPKKEKLEQKVVIVPDVVNGTSTKKSISVTFCCKQLGGLQAQTKVNVTQ